MACPISPEHINAFKMFIKACTAQPEIINMPQLDFFKNFIEDLGGKIPDASFEIPKCKPEQQKKKEEPAAEETPKVESEDDSDIELDMEGCVSADTEEPHEMGDASKPVTEEDMDKASDVRVQAAEAFMEQDYDKAISIYTDAIKICPTNALFFAKRGQAYLKQIKPNACIRDCNRALELNCDSAAAYKYRGRANRLLGNWEDAAKDLRQACKLDFDEEADEWLKEVTPNAKKIEQHKVKQERKKVEKEIKLKQERLRQAKEANQRAADANQSSSFDPREGMNFKNLFGDMDLNDPEIRQAFMDIKDNPNNISKYKDNPKIMKMLGFLGNMMNGMGGMPDLGGMSDFASQFASQMPSNSETPPPKSAKNPKTNLQDEDLD